VEETLTPFDLVPLPSQRVYTIQEAESAHPTLTCRQFPPSSTRTFLTCQIGRMIPVQNYDREGHRNGTSLVFHLLGFGADWGSAIDMVKLRGQR
jgi:hypothetical protein